MEKSWNFVIVEKWEPCISLVHIGLKSIGFELASQNNFVQTDTEPGVDLIHFETTFILTTSVVVSNSQFDF